MQGFAFSFLILLWVAETGDYPSCFCREVVYTLENHQFKSPYIVQRCQNSEGNLVLIAIHLVCLTLTLWGAVAQW